MNRVEFRISSNWRVAGNIEDVYDVISKPEDFTRWWSDVYLDVLEIEHGDDRGVGKTVNLHTRGLLPYTLTWQARAIEVDKPDRLVIEAHGDLEGRGEWHLHQDGDYVQADYDWTVVTNKPWMKWLAPLFKPVFAANHRWAMSRGLEGLRRELNRAR